MTTDIGDLLRENIAYIDHTAQRFVPHGSYRHFFRWALGNTNPNRDMWLQLTGLKQLIKMTSELLQGVVVGNDWQAIMMYSLPINAYLTYEVTSDNLALGITHRNAHAMRDYMVRFNQVMIDRLAGKIDDAHAELSKASYGATISTFKQSLSPEKHHAMALAYIKAHPQTTLADLEFNPLPLLVANIETAHQLYSDMGSMAGGSIVRDGLMARYQAVNTLILSPNLTLEERINLSRDTILVVPTIGYYIAIIAECIQKHGDFKSFLDDGLVLSALQDGALLVRLLNDLGTLVKQSPEEHRRVIDSLKCNAGEFDTFREFISQPHAGAHITRLQKDAIHGEFNLAFNGLEDALPHDGTLRVFLENLEYLSLVYSTTFTRMENTLKQIDRYPQYAFISTVIRRFVYFHQYIYSQPYHAEAKCNG